MLNKKFLIITGSIVFTLLAVGTYLLFEHVNPWIENKLATQLDSLNQASIQLKYADLNVNILSGSADINEVSYNSEDSANVYEITFDKLRIDGLGVMSFLMNKEIKFDDILLENPHLKWTRKTVIDSTYQQQENEEKKKLPSILVKNFRTTSGSFAILNRNEETINPLLTGEFKLALDQLRVDSAERQRFKFFDLHNLVFDLRNVEMNMPDSLFKMSIKEIDVDLLAGSVHIDSIHYNSRYKKFKIGHVANHEIDWMDVTTKSIDIAGINTEMIISQGLYLIQCITINDLNASIFRDKPLVFPNKPDTKLLHQIMAELGVKVNIDTIKVKKADIQYEEFVKQAVGPGVVSFNNLYASVYNITNIDTLSEKVKHRAYMDAQCNVMNKTLLQASFSFPLREGIGKYTASGKMKDADLADFNPMLQEVAFVKIEKGHLIDLSFEFNYDLYRSDGSMNFIYEDLKINTLDKESNESTGLGEEIKSFLANTFIVKTNNKADNSFRVGAISAERDPKKSVFNYWWKSLLTGFRSSTGIQEPKERIDMN